MTPPMTHAELLAALEAATGPDPHLDAEIGMLSGLDVRPFPDGGYYVRGETPECDSPVPSYTGSVDTALTLVPKGWFWRVGRTSLFQAWAGVYQTHPDHGEPNRNEFYWHRDHGGPPSTPALALCIAALKALLG